MTGVDAEPSRFALAEGTGNRFLLWDRWDEPPRAEVDARADERELARDACRALGVDGLLTLARPRVGGDLRMVLHNSDGSRPEACGNGLRVLAGAFGRVAGRAVPAPLVVETDAGPREAWPLPARDGVDRARVSLGVPRLVARGARLATTAGVITADLVDVGNPHCVVFVEDLAGVDAARLGPALERHARFPAGTNVELVQRERGGLRLRVWERGVGETASCGSGVVAAAFAARSVADPQGPRRVETPGGCLRVSFARDGRALLEGPALVRSPDAAEHATLAVLRAAVPPAVPPVFPPAESAR